jgi:hypothetical protein
MMNNKSGAISGMRINEEKQSTRRKLSPDPLRPPQILHHLTLDSTWYAVMVPIYESNANILFSLTAFFVTEFKIAEL